MALRLFWLAVTFLLANTLHAQPIKTSAQNLSEHGEHSEVAQLETAITGISPAVGTGGTKVVLTGFHPFRSFMVALPGHPAPPIIVKFGALPAAYFPRFSSMMRMTPLTSSGLAM